MLKFEMIFTLVALHFHYWDDAGNGSDFSTLNFPHINADVAEFPKAKNPTYVGSN